MKKRLLTISLACLMLLASCTPSSDDTSGTGGDTFDALQSDVQSDNENESSLYVNPDFSLKGGIYKKDASLELSLPENAPDGAYITYTTNGDEPSRKKGKYTEPIQIFDDDDSTVIRAACFDKDGNPIGRIKTNTYIRSENGITTAPYVVSIATDNDNLTGADGIITNYQNSGKEWERVCHVEIFNSNGDEVISQDAGLRIFGGSSRSLAQKSFRLVARRDGYYDEMLYNGNGSFDYAFFPDRKIESGQEAGNVLERFDRLVLRNGGNDSLLNSYTDGKLVNSARDSAVNLFAMKYAPSVASQASCFVSVFLNGEYYGVLDMKEDIDDNYISNLYGIEDKDNITVVKSELDTSIPCNGGHDYECLGGRFCGSWFYYEVDNGSQDALDEYIDLCQRVVSCDDSEYDTLYNELESKIDLKNFIEYTALNMFVCNTDWGHNNLKLWCYSGENTQEGTYADGKWRFAMRDCDFAFGRYESYHILPELYTHSDTNTFDFVLQNYYSGTYEYVGGYSDPLYIKGLLAFCLKNDQFRGEFEQYCVTLCSDEAKEHLLKIFGDHKDTLTPLIPNQIERWSDRINREYSFRTWTRQMTAMDDWAKTRGTFFLMHMENALKNFE